jgi:DNA-binding transcriptional ArsR family regulator
MMEYIGSMARAATTSDVFNAIAEPRRRALLDRLSHGGEHPVGDLVAYMKLPQPAVSKHLGVLRKVGLVSMKKRGQRRVYALEAGELKRVYDWAKQYERFWNLQLDRIKERAEQMAKERSNSSTDPSLKES